MPNWKHVLDEITKRGGTHDIVRRKYLRRLSAKTGRNTIAYYSGWLQKSSTTALNIPFGINDSDKNAFMTMVSGLDRSKGLDLILHTPGGEVSATESIVDYLRSMFGKDIRAIVPQIAMSAGSMIALSCKIILMGKHSNIGPVDPQIGGMPARAIIEEFNLAQQMVAGNPHCAPLWQAIFSKLSPSVIVSSQHALAMAELMVKGFLTSNMFDGDADADTKADRIVQGLTDMAQTRACYEL